MTCKDCTHYEACADWYEYFNSEEFKDCEIESCKMFKDKSKIIELPCKVGDVVYYITAWDAYADQHDHEQEVKAIEIRGKGINIYLQNDTKLCLKDFNKWWFIDKESWIKAKEIYCKAHKQAEKRLEEMM